MGTPREPEYPMSILTLSRREVKPTRKSSRKPAPFGQGILPSAPTFKAPAPSSDLEWAAQAFGEQSDRFDTIELTLLDARRPTVDELLHRGSDPKQCRCRPC